MDPVRRRTRFGVPAGSFQAVRHRLAGAKPAAGEAAYTTARTVLRLHGAIGYPAECDLSLWPAKARAPRSAWGTPAECRDLVLARGL